MNCFLSKDYLNNYIAYHQLSYEEGGNGRHPETPEYVACPLHRL